MFDKQLVIDDLKSEVMPDYDGELEPRGWRVMIPACRNREGMDIETSMSEKDFMQLFRAMQDAIMTSALLPNEERVIRRE